MGREIRRVPVDWKWPVGERWIGFINDEPPFPDCVACDATGYSREAYAIHQTFYAHMVESAVGAQSWPHATDAGAKSIAWHDKIGQAEVDNLIAEGRLRQWVDGVWKSVPLTAAEVNAAQHGGPLGGHDGLNRHILVEFRCKVLGIEMSCATCHGHGDIATDAEREHRDAWERTDPPAGDGWQVWETVSEGSPITPVFATAEELVDYLSTKGTTWDTTKGPWRRSAAEQFVKDGFAMTGVTVGGKWFNGARDADLLAEPRNV